MTSTLIGERAVVVGAGMAGLHAARALADYFEHVVVLERDALPPDAPTAMGTPPGVAHPRSARRRPAGARHGLFAGLSGTSPQPERCRLLSVSMIRLEIPGYDPLPARDLGWVGYAMSRPLVEFILRRRTEQHANVDDPRKHCRARDLVASREGGAVSAIRFENSHGRSETIAADWWSEASGRGNLTAGFLGSIGRRRPEEHPRSGSTSPMPQGVFAVPDDAACGLDERDDV